ncbi:MmpS family transport accessory protein [Mycobacterium sp. 050128]|uniref:MmpS family transport accessory protein n=1 Tax=Mycobacterium sp. 050128 TaxID=3096112 RepID=UPI002EDA6532
MTRFSIGGIVRRRWTVIVTVLVVTLAGFGVYRLHGIFGSNDVVSWPRADSIENSNYDPKQVLFEVVGSPGAVATINYLDEHAQPQRVDDTTLPWSHLLTTTDPTLFADLRAQGDADSLTLTCRITVNGIVKVERSTNNVNGYIACLDKSA